MDELKKQLEEVSLIMSGMSDISVLMGTSDFAAGSNCLTVMANYGSKIIEQMQETIDKIGLFEKR